MGLGMRMRLAGRLALQTTDPRRFAQDRSALLRAGRRRYKPTVVRKPDPPSGNDGDPAVARTARWATAPYRVERAA